MAHHHKGRFNPVHGIQNFQSMENMPTTTESSFTLDDELATEADEPPDEGSASRSFSLYEPGTTLSSGSFAKIQPPRLDRKKSLLSQALAPDSESNTPDHSEESNIPNTLMRGSSNASTTSCVSIGSTAGLTSDGGLTSPARTNTPSPPPPSTDFVVPLDHFKEMVPVVDVGGVRGDNNAPTGPVANEHANVPLHAPAINAGLGRKSCIRFACDRKDGTGNAASNPAERTPNMENAKVEEKPKRPCALRFVCPFKDTGQAKPINKAPDTHRKSSPPPPATAPGIKVQVTTRAPPVLESIDHTVSPPIALRDTPNVGDNDLGAAEARKFHEFASSADEEEDWMNEKSDYKHKLTVEDTLRKEKSIQKLAEEVEEEALEEADARNAAELDDDDSDVAEDEDEDGNEDDEDEGESESESISDDGNESDDEGGFAESDDETDAGSEYQFWTPGPSTAATSLDPADHNRRHVRRLISKLSSDSITGTTSSNAKTRMSPPHSSRALRPVSIKDGTPPLPDSTDFVCGTLDEDRPLEDAYASCMEQRKRLTHTAVPQDIDPSFPTSDLDDEDEDDNIAEDGKRIVLVMGDDDNSIGGPGQARRKAGIKGKSPIRSPKRLHSPPPLRRTALAKTPPTRRFVRLSPDSRAHTQAIESRTPSHPSSSAVSPKDRSHIPPFHVTHRPGLRCTASLPRSPNPYYQQLRKGHQVIAKGNSSRQSSPNGHRTRKSFHRRGAIDIVCGLEQKRQRRKEKAWFKFCQRGVKCRERKPLPGQGAEKMRELGLEKAGKNKGNGAKYVLSI